MAIEKVLIVDENPANQSFLQDLLRKRKSEVFVANDIFTAKNYLNGHLFDLIISDLQVSGSSGLEILKTAKAKHPQTLVILTTAFASIENAVEAMRLGAFNYLIRPFSAETLDTMLDKVQEHIDL